MPVNIYDIAEKAGVSVVTVSRVLNNHPSVRGYNREKVLSAMDELDYKPNAAARTLAKGRSGMVGLVMPSFDDAFLTQILQSVEKELAARNLFLVLATDSGQPDLSLESGCIRMLREGRVDGILMLSPVNDNSYMMELKKRNIPFVLLDQHQRNLQASSVTADNFFGGYQATMCLIRGGAGKIAHISGPESYESSRERLRGFRKALDDSRLKLDERHLFKGDFSFQSGYRAVKEWASQGCMPDAVFACDDNAAFGVIDAARELGISIPDSLAVIGYDDHPFTSLFHPGISTVRQPAEKMAESGVELLLEIMEGKVKRLTKVTLKPAIIERGTTKPTEQTAKETP
jgi:DNA-binding LacI/PurR family transcriptional regulator